MNDDQLNELDDLVNRIRGGDGGAKRVLFERTTDRLKNLTRKMLRGFSSVRRWEETDDVWQNVSMRIWRSFEDVEFESARHFLNLAAMQIRRELLNLAESFRRPSSHAANYATPTTREIRDGVPAAEPSSPTDNLERLNAWTELHRCVENMDEELREVFQLHWYQGLSQEQVAQLTGVSDRTVRRRWQAARLELYEKVSFEF